MLARTILVDFDGTCVTHDFPKIGKEIGAAKVLKELTDKGHQLILFTMRSDIVNPTGEDNELHLVSGNYLTEAVNWFKQHDIPLYGIQTNPTQHTWTTSPKAYGHLMIDDSALGIPLITFYSDEEEYEYFLKHRPYSKRPYVNWEEVRKLLKEKNYL